MSSWTLPIQSKYLEQPCLINPTATPTNAPTEHTKKCLQTGLYRRIICYPVTKNILCYIFKHRTRLFKHTILTCVVVFKFPVSLK